MRSGLAIVVGADVDEGDGVAVADCLAVGNGVAIGVDLSVSVLTGVSVGMMAEVWVGALAMGVSVMEAGDEVAHAVSQINNNRTRLIAPAWMESLSILLTSGSFATVMPLNKCVVYCRTS